MGGLGGRLLLRRPRAAHAPLLAPPPRSANIAANYLPLPTDLTYEGLVKDYYFDTYGCARAVRGEGQENWGIAGMDWSSPGCAAAAAVPPPPSSPDALPPAHGRSNGSRQACTDLFCPIYSVGVSPDPLVDTPDSAEFYLAVGLDSGVFWRGGGGGGYWGGLRGGVCIGVAAG